MSEYLERRIKEESEKIMRNYYRAFFTYLITGCVAMLALFISGIVGSVEWKKAIAEFLSKDWISHSGFTSNLTLISFGIIAGLIILTIPFYRKLKEVEKLRQQLKKPEAGGSSE